MAFQQTAEAAAWPLQFLYNLAINSTAQGDGIVGRMVGFLGKGYTSIWGGSLNKK
jgi:hypothetical protein